jgi:hypothetical protein
MRIDSSGNVGIGTSSPTAKLQVTNTTTSTSSYTNDLISFTASPATSSATYVASEITATHSGANGNNLSGSLIGLRVIMAESWGGTTNAYAIQTKISSTINYQSITNGYNFYADSPSFPTNTNLATAYGLYIAKQKATNVTTGYGIYQADSADINYFAGNVTVVGAVSKGSGSFRIEHPLPEKSATHQLVHSFIEGPQADLIYRGKVVLVEGKASVNIDTESTMTEGTFEVLCREVQCFTTNETGWTAVRGKVVGNVLTIEAKETNCTDEISWMVIGERQDPHMMETEWTDDNGKVIVEPLKPITQPIALETA